MGILEDFNIRAVRHYTPLHYFPYIARSLSLKCKPLLQTSCFSSDHFRSKSQKQDIARGFEPYIHLCIKPYPEILNAKLSAGFPHIGISIPANHIEEIGFSLCRFNVAMTRCLRRHGKSGFPECVDNGRYYDNLQIPIAKGDDDKRAMLRAHLSKSTIEVLIYKSLILPPETEIEVFSPYDFDVVAEICTKVEVPWRTELVSPSGRYPHNTKHREDVNTFIELSLSDPSWRGNGLEFDRL